MPGEPTADRFACAARDLDLPALTDLARRVFMVQLRDFLDPRTFDVKKAMKWYSVFYLTPPMNSLLATANV